MLMTLFVFQNVHAGNWSLEPGKYQGEYIKIVESPAGCGGNEVAGNNQITFIDSDTIHIEAYLIYNDNYIPLGSETVNLTGKTMHYDTQDQVIDMAQWGLDAVVKNQRSRGVAVWKSPTQFVKHFASQRNTCEGTDCDFVAEWMLGVDGSFPCNILPVTMEFNKVSE